MQRYGGYWPSRDLSCLVAIFLNLIGISFLFPEKSGFPFHSNRLVRVRSKIAQVFSRRVGIAHQIQIIEAVNGGQCPPY